MGEIPNWAIFLGTATIMAYLPMALSKANQALGGAARMGRAALAGVAVGAMGAGVAAKAGFSLASNAATRGSAALAARGRMQGASRLHRVASFSQSMQQRASRATRTSAHLMAQAAAGHYYIPLHRGRPPPRPTGSPGVGGSTPTPVRDPESRHQGLLKDAQEVTRQEEAKPGGKYGDVGQRNTKRYRQQYGASRTKLQGRESQEPFRRQRQSQTDPRRHPRRPSAPAFGGEQPEPGSSRRRGRKKRKRRRESES